MEFLSNIYSKYHNLIEYSEYAFTGWALSWFLFFIMLPFMIHFFGKAKGAIINYGFSYISMILIILGLEFSIK
jgi:ABC-type multidrug transport system permease subunit